MSKLGEEDLSALDREVASYLIELLKTDSALRHSLSAAMTDAGGLKQIVEQFSKIERQLGGLKTEVAGLQTKDTLAELVSKLDKVQAGMSAGDRSRDNSKNLLLNQPNSRVDSYPERAEGQGADATPRNPATTARAASAGIKPEEPADIATKLQRWAANPVAWLVIAVPVVIALGLLVWMPSSDQPATEAGPAETRIAVDESLNRDLDSAWAIVRSEQLMTALQPVCPKDASYCSLNNAQTRARLASLPADVQRDAAAALLSELVASNRCELTPLRAPEGGAVSSDPKRRDDGTTTAAGPAKPDAGKTTLLLDLVACLRAR